MKKFFSKPIFQIIGWVIIIVLYIAFLAYVLYISSEVLLFGIESADVSAIAHGIGGYIFLSILGTVFVVIFVYWVSFSQGYDWEFRQIRSDLRLIRRLLDIYSSTSVENHNLLYDKIKERLNGTLTKNDFNKKFGEIEKKIDQLIEQQK